MQAARKYYSFDFAKPFWDALVNFAHQGRIVSIDKVYNEIMRGNDKLKDWADSDFKEFFHPTHNIIPVVEHYASLVYWVEAEIQFKPLAVKSFLEDENADAWVIAYAKLHKLTLVTSENNSKGEIPIPTVCNEFNIRCIDTFVMLKELNFSF